MEVEQLVPGLWRWTGRHEDLGPGELEREVGCVYYESADGVCLIDPLVPPEEPDRFLAALDRDVARIGGPVHVLLTLARHARSADALVARYGADDRRLLTSGRSHRGARASRSTGCPARRRSSPGTRSSAGCASPSP